MWELFILGVCSEKQKAALKHVNQMAAPQKHCEQDFDLQPIRCVNTGKLLNLSDPHL